MLNPVHIDSVCSPIISRSKVICHVISLHCRSPCRLPHPYSEGSTLDAAGYIPSSVYTTRTEYRNQTYPTFSSSHASSASLPSPYNPAQHNLYSVTSNMSRRYDSADELQSPPGDYNPADSMYKRPNDPALQYQQSQQQPFATPSPLHHRHGGSVDLLDTELSPSKFGSKRESHADRQTYPDSEDGYRTYPGSLGGHHGTHPQSSKQYAPEPSGNTQWYVGNEPMMVHRPRQQDTPTSYPMEDSNVSYEGMDLSQMESPASQSQHQQSLTVTKYQNYVEVSKPFEMSDFYKYSEKLRRQRVSESPTQAYQGQSSSYATSSLPHDRSYNSLGRKDSFNSASSPYGSEDPRPASPYNMASAQHISSYHPPMPMTCDALPRPRSKTPSISSQRIV